MSISVPVTLAPASPDRVPISATPRLFLISLVAILAGLALFTAIALSIVEAARHDTQTIGDDSPYSVIDAQKIRALSADMDANASNAALTRGDAQRAAWALYDKDRQQVEATFVDAASHISYPSESDLITKISVALSTYEDMVGRARQIMYSGEADTNQDGLWVALIRASSMMTYQILPWCDQLDKVNRDQLNSAWQTRLTSAGIEGWAVIGGSLPALLAILFAMGVNQRRLRRLVSPGLAVAFVALLAADYTVITAIHQNRADLKIAKEAAFDSVLSLWQARAYAYEANGAESAYLLNGLGASGAERDYKIAASKVGPISVGLTQMAEAKRAATDPLGRTKVTSFAKTFLGEELNNITFFAQHEGDEAYAAFDAWATYVTIDHRIRELETSGHHDEAIALCIGTEHGDSNWAFARFDDAIEKTISINYAAFQKAIADSYADVRTVPWIVLGLMFVTVGTSVGALSWRIRYRPEAFLR